MKSMSILAALALAVALGPLASPANAKGCVKGAVVGGVAGHFVHHGWLGAAAGCMIGHHEAAKHERQQQNHTTGGYGR